MGNAKAPERIIICVDGYKPAIADWAKDKMKECDIEYVRADLLAQVEQERDALRQEVEGLRYQRMFTDSHVGDD